jgi:hypothetical protein
MFYLFILFLNFVSYVFYEKNRNFGYILIIFTVELGGPINKYSQPTMF